MALDLSLGEFQALVAKALRGAGYQWGFATDGAYAARVLAQQGLPAADIVSSLLAEADTYGLADVTIDEILDAATPICPVTLGAALSDLGDLAIDQFPGLVGSRRILEPLMLVPFVADCVVAWSQGQTIVSAHTFEVQGTLARGSHRVELIHLDAASMIHTPNEPATRAIVSPESHMILDQFAHRTYAPATEASRRGAGEASH